MSPRLDPAVAKVFASFPPAIRAKSKALRKLILATAADTDAVAVCIAAAPTYHRDKKRARRK